MPGAAEPGEVIATIDEDQAEVEAKCAELAAGEIVFSQWLGKLSTELKVKIIDEFYGKAENYKTLKNMVEHVRSRQTLGTCSKCRFSPKGCEYCNYEQSLNYVLRRGQVAAWYKAKLFI